MDTLTITSRTSAFIMLPGIAIFPSTQRTIDVVSLKFRDYVSLLNLLNSGDLVLGSDEEVTFVTNKANPYFVANSSVVDISSIDLQDNQDFLTLTGRVSRTEMALNLPPYTGSEYSDGYL